METFATLSRETTEEASALPNKYLYPEFAGWHGERYLKKLLRQILPMALYRTWEIFADHQAIGNDCYLGVTHLAEIAGRTTRTIEKNLASLCAKQLLVERAERKVFRSSTGVVKNKVVIIKDFAGLYALAHEYHEWLNSDEFVAADREMVALLDSLSGLVAKLRRFDNYRKVLYNRLPGPLSQEREEDRWFTEYQPEQYFSITEHEPTKEAKQLQRERIPAKDPLKHLAKDVAKGSAKRITKSNTENRQEGDSFDSALSSSLKNPLKDEGYMETSDGHQQRTLHIASDEPTHEEQKDILPLPPPQTPAPLAQKRHLQSDDGKQEGEGIHEDAMRASQGRARTRVGNASRSQSDQMTPSQHLASSFVREIAAPFGDLNPKGTHTRILSILKNAQLDQPVGVLVCLIRAYVVARDTRTIRPEHCRPETGQANRMPLFCSMFQRFVDARVQGNWWDAPTWQQIEEEIAFDACLTPWWNEYQSIVGEVPSYTPDELTGLHYLSDAQHPGEEQKMALQANEVQSYCARRPRLSQTDEQREERATLARSVLRRLLHMTVPIQGPTVLWEHVNCGCPLYHQRRGKEVCALCFPNPEWPLEALSLLQSIVEGKTTPSHKNEESENTDEQAEDWTTTAIDGEQPARSGDAEWTEREDAYAYGVYLLEAMTSNGYVVEVRLRPVGSHYQVVLRGADGEYLCERPEHVEYLIEQAQNRTL